MLAQVNSFVENSSRVDENALYIIWVGANDYLIREQTNPLVPVDNIRAAVATLNKVWRQRFSTGQFA